LKPEISPSETNSTAASRDYRAGKGQPFIAVNTGPVPDLFLDFLIS